MKALRGLEKFSGGGGWVGGWVVHKVIIVSVRVLYVGFFGQDRTPGFSDRTGRDAELDNSSFLDVSLSD